MTPNLISSRLASKTAIRQVEASLRADAAAARVDRVVLRLWRAFMAMLKQRRPENLLPPSHVRHRTRLAFGVDLPSEIGRSILRSLRAMARWGHHSARATLFATLPTPYLRAAAGRRLFESVQTPVMEDRPRKRADQPGVIALTLRALGLKAEDLARPLREPARSELSDEAQREIFARLLFPPPSEDLLSEIIYAPVHGTAWHERLARATRTSASPEDLAEIVGGGFALGKTPQQIARDLLPAVDQVRTTAKRIARTEGMRVAHAVQMNAWNGLGEMVVGFQHNATLDQHTRPWHAARNGKVYKVDASKPQDPTWGPYLEEWGYRRPPEEPEDPGARPGGAPAMAWNCRCGLSPVLGPDPAIADDPALLAQFTNAQDKLVSDPVSYSEWFDRADDKRRRRAVGARRYAAVKDAVGEPSWEHFIDPATGDLLGLDRLKNEDEAARAARVEQVRRVMAERRELLRQVQTLGFVMG